MWAEIHEEMIEHPKTIETYEYLGCSQWEAFGIEVGLMLWGLSYANKDGSFKFKSKDLGKRVLAKYMTFHGEGCKMTGQAIVDGLIACGWIDEVGEQLYIHDWDTWQTAFYKAMERREADVERKRRARAKAEKQGDDQEEIPLPEDPPESPPEEPNGEEPEAPVEEPKKAKKVKYAEFVSMTEKSYVALCEKYGKEFTDACVAELDNYKGSNGKRYKDDYRAILSWVVDRVSQKRPGLLQQSRSNMSQQATADGMKNPFTQSWE